MSKTTSTGTTNPEREAWKARAKDVRIEDECARRGFKLRRQGQFILGRFSARSYDGHSRNGQLLGLLRQSLALAETPGYRKCPGHHEDEQYHSRDRDAVRARPLRRLGAVERGIRFFLLH